MTADQPQEPLSAREYLGAILPTKQPQEHGVGGVHVDCESKGGCLMGIPVTSQGGPSVTTLADEVQRLQRYADAVYEVAEGHAAELATARAELQCLQAQLAQLTAERDEFKQMARRSEDDEKTMDLIHRAAVAFSNEIDVAVQLDHLRARCAQLEAAAKKAVSSYGGPYHERAIELLSAALDQHATSSDA